MPGSQNMISKAMLFFSLLTIAWCFFSIRLTAARRWYPMGALSGIAGRPPLSVTEAAGVIVCILLVMLCAGSFVEEPDKSPLLPAGIVCSAMLPIPLFAFWALLVAVIPKSKPWDFPYLAAIMMGSAHLLLIVAAGS